MVTIIDPDKPRKSHLNSFFEFTGLDWLPILIDERRFINSSKKDPNLEQPFEMKKAALKGDSLVAVIRELERRRDEDEKRQSSIESKAFSLLGFISLASTFIVGLSQINGNGNKYHPLLLIIIVILYLCIGSSLLITIILARRAIMVGKYKYMAPSLINLLDLTDESPDEARRAHLEALFYSYVHNRALINDKASYVVGAQDWFRNTLVLLFLLAVLLAIQPFMQSANGAAFEAITTEEPDFTAEANQNTPEATGAALTGGQWTPEVTPVAVSP